MNGSSRPLTDGVVRSLRSSRWVLAAALAVVALVGLDRPLRAAAGLLCAAVVALAAGLERSIVVRSGRARIVSTGTVAVDLAAVALALGLAGITLDHPASALVALPLVQAGFRHGASGWTVATSCTALLACLQLAVTWDGRPSAIVDWLVGFAVAVALSWPTAHVVDRVVRESAARRRDDHDRLARSAELVVATSRGVASIVDGGGRRDDALVRAVQTLAPCSATIGSAFVDAGPTPDGAGAVDQHVVRLDAGRHLTVALPPICAPMCDDLIAAIETLASVRTHCASLPDDVRHDVPGDVRRDLDRGVHEEVDGAADERSDGDEEPGGGGAGGPGAVEPATEDWLRRFDELVAPFPSPASAERAP